MIKSFYAEKDYDPYLFLKFGSEDNKITTASSASDKLVGVGTNVPALKDKPAEGVLLGEAELRLGGTVTRGERLTSDADGKGVIAAEGNTVKAIALQSGTANDIIRVCVV